MHQCIHKTLHHHNQASCAILVDAMLFLSDLVFSTAYHFHRLFFSLSLSLPPTTRLQAIFHPCSRPSSYIHEHRSERYTVSPSYPSDQSNTQTGRRRKRRKRRRRKRKRRRRSQSH